MAELNRDAYTRYADIHDGNPTRNVPRNMLRADNSMSYLDFIAMVEYLWQRVHPDIPIRPVQSAAFEKYPVIVYSLELRRPHQAEPKERYREQVMDSVGHIYSIRAQRFQNVVSFSAIDRNNPETVEAIIEAFESFMFEYTPTLKKLGVSELFYSRRVSDSESTRSNEDTNVRTVQYMVTLEKVRYIQEDLLEEVLVDVRLFLNNNRSPGFSVEADQVGTPFITLWRNSFLVEVGDKVLLKSIDNSIYSFPKGINSYRTYTVSSISSDNSATPSRIVLGLQDSNGIPISSSSTGQGSILHSILDNFDINIEDNVVSLPDKIDVVTPTIGIEEISLSWNEPSSDSVILDYVVEYSTDNVSWTTFVDDTSAATSATVTGLTNDVLYYFRVSAVNLAGQGAPSDVVSAVPNVVLSVGPTLWLDASDEATINHTGGSVTRWDDKSGNDHNVEQGTAIKQPTTGTRRINGLNVLDFDGTDSLVENTITATQPITIFAVIESDEDLVGGAGYYFDSPTISYRANTNSRWRLNAGNDINVAGRTNDPQIHRIVINDVNTSVHIDGAQVTSGFSPGVNDLSGITIGADYLLNTPMNGAWAEMVVVDRILTSQEIADIEQYLTDKWVYSVLDLSPALWLDASDVLTINHVNGLVSQWDDKSGNGNNLEQLSSANQPTTDTRTVNDLNVIDFDGSSDFMDVSYPASIDQPFTIWVVTRNDSPTSAGIIYSGLSTFANSSLYLAGTISAHWINGGDPTLSYSTAPDSVLNLYRVEFNGASSAFYINGDQKVAGTTGTHSPTGLRVGANVNGATNYDGVIGELIVAPGTLTTQQIEATEDYLIDKWGVGIFSPLDLSPTLWLDASDTSTIIEDPIGSGAVSQWDDKSGNGYNLTQGTGLYQPKTGTATINSLNVLEFDTANGQQHVKNATFPLIGNDYDMFIVLQVNPADLDYVLFSSGNKNGVVGRALSGSAGTATASGMTYSSLHVDSALFTGTTVGQLWTATATGSPIVVRGTQVSSVTYDGFSVSRVANDPGFSDGTVVCEVIVADYPLTAQQISDTETYLADKWGITL
jgi:hypothetical protein